MCTARWSPTGVHARRSATPSCRVSKHMEERRVGVVGEPRSVPNLPGPDVAYEHPLATAWRTIATHAEAVGQGMVRVPLADGPRWLVRRSGHAFNSFQEVIRSLSRFPHFELVFGA